MKALVGCWAVLGALTAHAAGFSVGRVDIEFADEGWKELSLPDQEVAFGGDKAGALDVASKLYLRGTPDGDDQILVIVGAHSEGIGGGRASRMSYSPKCRSDEQNYREGNEGFRESFAQCLVVTPRYNSESVFKALAPELLALQASGVVSVRRPVYTVWSHHAISTGSFVDVRVFVISPIGVDKATVEDTLPKGVLPEHVAWGRQLKDAVKSSVYSLSGRLVVPAIRLSPSASGAAGGGG